MKAKRRVGLFSAGCPACREAEEIGPAACCAGRGLDEGALRAAGIGRLLS